MTFPIKNWLRAILFNPNIITVIRKFTQLFPAIEEDLWAWLYLVRKKIIFSHPQSSLAKEIPAVVNLKQDKPQLLIDVSSIVVRDAKNGVHRVVRGLLLEFMRHPPENYVIEPVRINAAGQLCYARNLVDIWTKNKPRFDKSLPVTTRQGDIFYCPDIYLSYNFSALSNFQRNGLRLIFTIHDIIPLQHPAFFSKALRLGFTDWFEGVMSTTDEIVCVSRAVADEMVVWLQRHPKIRNRRLPISFFHLGADIEYSPSVDESKTEDAIVLSACQRRPTLLMVGTLEPRKGHSHALAALEQLWGNGVDINLVIIGNRGWSTELLARKLATHSERGRRLFWLVNASDGILLDLYARASVLLAPSFAEGFGLPLIEAARQGLPIIARDIPIFREVAGQHAFYFDSDTAEGLAEAIKRWLILYVQSKAPSSGEMPWLTWADSAKQLQDIIIKKSRYKVWQYGKINDF